MGTLVITEGGVDIACEGERLRVRRGQRILQEVRLQELEAIVALATVGLTARAARRLLTAGIELTFLDQQGQLLGRLSGPSARNVVLRVEQHRRALDEGFALSLARRIVAGKIRNQRRLLLRYRSRRAGDEIRDAALRLRMMAEQGGRCEDRERLLGHEGAASHVYFGVFNTLILNPLFQFSGRNRRPPRDPVNACLSFGYTVLGSLLEGELAGVGLDPMVGFLHRPEYGRPSLALDLLEELRAVVVDSMTLTLINRRQLVPSDFGPPERSGAARAEELAPWLEPEKGPTSAQRDGAVYLSRTGRPIFFRAFLNTLRGDVLDPEDGTTVALRELLRRQCRRLAAAIRTGDPDQYTPYEPVS